MRESPDPADWRDAIEHNEATLTDAARAAVLREGRRGVDYGPGGEASMERRE